MSFRISSFAPYGTRHSHGVLINTFKYSYLYLGSAQSIYPVLINGNRKMKFEIPKKCANLKPKMIWHFAWDISSFNYITSYKHPPYDAMDTHDMN